MELLLAYLHFQQKNGEVIQADLLKKANASAAQLKGLIEKGILVTEKKAVDRIEILPQAINTNFTLSPAQSNALLAIQQSFQEKQVCLLHGI
ncbi:hypothetical protein ABTO79_19080, partial [Acinetobacter baumannii]